MRRIVTIALLLMGLTLLGTVGLRIITGGTWLDCLYLTVITLTTVGLDEVLELGDAGKLFIIFYLITCLGIFTYCAFQLGQWIVSAELRSLWEGRRMRQNIDKLHNHYIVCGLGRMGETICQYLHARKKPFVVIEADEEVIEQSCLEEDCLYIVGDATDDDVLLKAGIEQAMALASVLPTDADNVYVILSARMLTSELQIVARASEQKAIEKMERAGATRIVSPFSSGAVKMARFMLNPTIEDFLEVADSWGHDLELADVLITDQSPYVGKQLMETDLTSKGVMVIGIRRANGERLMPPSGSAVIHPGDSLFAFGSSTSVNDMIGEHDAGG